MLSHAPDRAPDQPNKQPASPEGTNGGQWATTPRAGVARERGGLGEGGGLEKIGFYNRKPRWMRHEKEGR